MSDIQCLPSYYARFPGVQQKRDVWGLSLLRFFPSPSLGSFLSCPSPNVCIRSFWPVMELMRSILPFRSSRNSMRSGSYGGPLRDAYSQKHFGGAGGCLRGVKGGVYKPYTGYVDQQPGNLCVFRTPISFGACRDSILDCIPSLVYLLAGLKHRLAGHDGSAAQHGEAAPAAAKLGRRRRTVIHSGESGRGAARPFPCSAGGDLLFTVLTEAVVSVGAVTWGERWLGSCVSDRMKRLGERWATVVMLSSSLRKATRDVKAGCSSASST
uniref:Uncharacterized protein n=1 Tax=Chromera velia CCMP2878 TaxID=1169474 RepID=A0A0G4F5F3_9ALVE|eukprot:Cvel_15084.t1-p1 / transcript=Cvel_15084.t1 / gene=Cvel_15084 / organism=Chromera_velia_CCMP2878 / gene_product=hypothetical protein / transcript_product=hypothetical protein / location=Cvel_scaffold1100:20251-22670(+) / protein_length=267 / sequence_SO=supercontig / SO=protein_coding / is_pseudo=false